MFSILSRRLYPEKIGFWVWVLDWVLYSNPNQKNFIHKPKTKKILYPNPKPKPKKFYTQIQNEKNFIPKPKTKKILYPNTNPKPKKFYTQTQNLNPKPKNFYSQSKT